MLKLIKLELKAKNKGSILKALGPMFLTILISFILICFLMNIEYFLNNVDLNDFNKRYLTDKMPIVFENNYYKDINNISNSIFIIFSSIMCSKYIIKDYKDNKIQQLYLYSIPREKIIISKILIVIILSIVGNVIAKLIGLLIVNLFSNNADFSISMSLNFLLDSILIAFISLITAYIGVYKNSVISTIVSGFIITIILEGNIIPGFYLGEFILVNLSFAILGIITTLIIINKLKNKDV